MEKIIDIDISAPITRDVKDGMNTVDITAPVIRQLADDLGVNNKNITSFKLSLMEHSFEDSMQMSGVFNYLPAQVIQGQIFDFPYNALIESTSQKDLVQDLELRHVKASKMLSNFKISLPKKRKQHSSNMQAIDIQSPLLPGGIHVFIRRTNNEEKAKRKEEKEKKVSSYTADYVLMKVGEALGLEVRGLYDDFYLKEDLWGDVNYKSAISSVFGWSSSIPSMQINVFIRDNILMVVQRGKEEKTIDISDLPHDRPTIRRELEIIEPLYRLEDMEEQVSEDEEGYLKFVQVPYTGTNLDGTYVNGYLVKSSCSIGSINYSYTSDSRGNQYLSSSTRSDGSKTEYHYESTKTGLKLGSQTETILQKNDSGGYSEVKVTRYYHDHGNGQHSVDSWKEKDGKSSFIGTSIGQGRPVAVTPFTRKTAGLQMGERLFTEIMYYKEGSRASWREFSEKVLRLPLSTETDFNDKLLKKLMQEYGKLNRSIRETVSIDITPEVEDGVPSYQHIIDFDERIIYKGNEYFLVKNDITLTPTRLTQSLELVRWFRP